MLWGGEEKGKDRQRRPVCCYCSSTLYSARERGSQVKDGEEVGQTLQILAKTTWHLFSGAKTLITPAGNVELSWTELRREGRKTHVVDGIRMKPCHL